MAHLSQAFTLEPGDVIATGTPAGIGAVRQPFPEGLLKVGDVVRIEIEGIGELRTPWSRSPRVTSPRTQSRRQHGRADLGAAAVAARSAVQPDLAEVERIPLSERGLPASTYELVRRAAELWPDRPAVSVLPDAERFHTPLVRTFAELAQDVHRAAAVLAGLGVTRGDAVAVISVNCAEMLPLLLAAEAVGIYAPINPGLAPEHAIELLRLSGAKVIVASGPELDAARLGPRANHRRRPPARERCSRCARRQRRTNRPPSSRCDGVEVAYLQERMAALTEPSCPEAPRRRTRSPATCIPAARPARRSLPRGRTQTRSPTHG